MKLVARDICRSFDEHVILDGVDLVVQTGSSVAITGASGRGKSTLLSILGLLLEPSSGSLELDGRDLLALSDDEKAAVRNRSYGFLFQDTKLVGSLRTIENVLVPALLARVGDMRPRAEELLERFGLADRMQHFPHQLSIGQKRRASLARALLLEPDIVFADEPTNDLDEKNASTVADALLSLPDQGRAVVIATHDKELAQRADVHMEL